MLIDQRGFIRNARTRGFMRGPLEASIQTCKPKTDRCLARAGKCRLSRIGFSAPDSRCGIDRDAAWRLAGDGFEQLRGEAARRRSGDVGERQDAEQVLPAVDYGYPANVILLHQLHRPRSSHRRQSNRRRPSTLCREHAWGDLFDRQAGTYRRRVPRHRIPHFHALLPWKSHDSIPDGGRRLDLSQAGPDSGLPRLGDDDAPPGARRRP